MSGVDPFAVLGVAPGADEREVLAAYRDLAKQWHPDRGGGERAARRMAEINAAYDLLRAAAAQGPAPLPREDGRGRRSAHGAWLSDPVRHALGPELLVVLEPDEAVRPVTPVSTWASPRAVLAVTDRRLLWLLDDAPVARVHSLTFRNVAEVKIRVRRKRAHMTVRTLAGRRHVFHDLRPHTAATIEQHVLA